MTKTPRKKTPAAAARAASPWPAAPALEWIVSGLGLLLTVGALGFMLWAAFQPASGPSLSVQAVGMERAASGWVVEVEVGNAGRDTAAAVEVEGVLSAGGREIETSAMVLDYVPGQGKRRGGLVFENDPRTNELKLQTRGYVRP